MILLQSYVLISFCFSAGVMYGLLCKVESDTSFAYVFSNLVESYGLSISWKLYISLFFAIALTWPVSLAYFLTDNLK